MNKLFTIALLAVTLLATSTKLCAKGILENLIPVTVDPITDDPQDEIKAQNDDETILDNLQRTHLDYYNAMNRHQDENFRKGMKEWCLKVKDAADRYNSEHPND